MEEHFESDNDSEPLDQELYILPLVRVGVILGIAATALLGMECYEYFKQPAPNHPQQRKTLEQKVAFKTLYQSDTTTEAFTKFNQAPPRGIVVKTIEELNGLYINTEFPRRTITDGQSRRIFPDYQLDFSNEMVIAVFQGRKSTAGYSIDITDIIDTDDTLVVSSNLFESPRGILSSAVCTCPGHYVICKKSDKPVQFVWNHITPGEKIYLITPENSKPFYAHTSDISSEKHAELIEARSRQWFDRLQKDCQKLGFPKAFSDDDQQFPLAVTELEPDHVEKLKKLGYHVVKD